MLSPFEQTELTPGYLSDRTLLVSALTGSLFKGLHWKEFSDETSQLSELFCLLQMQFICALTTDSMIQ